MPYFLTRSCPIDTWRVVTERPVEGEVVELDTPWYGEACAERDQMNGKGDGKQEVLPI